MTSIADLKILIVEDNKTNQLVAKALLEKIGCLADTADDGFKGVKAVQEHPYDLVFMDMQMPGMDGLEATRQIRHQQGEAGPFIIALTANALGIDRQACYDAGMDGYISKPATLEKMRLAVEGVAKRLSSDQPESDNTDPIEASSDE